MARVTYSFTLDTQDDRQVIRWLEGLPKGDKSAAIREALRQYLGGAGVTLGDVYQAVKDLERKMGTGYVLVRQDGAEGAPEEPDDVAQALDNLGL